MITRDGAPVIPDEPTEVQEHETVCPTHHLTYHRFLDTCPECAAELAPVEQHRP